MEYLANPVVLVSTQVESWTMIRNLLSSATAAARYHVCVLDVSMYYWSHDSGYIPGGVGVINQAIYMLGVCQWAQEAHVCMHLSELAINDMFLKT